MIINRNNYETYFLSYIENRLQPGEVAELLVFLEQNPDLKTELDGLENITLNPDNQVFFRDKNRLKKREFKSTEHINSWNYEKQMIAMLEGDLAENELNEMKKFLRLNPHSMLELNLFRKTFLKPETIIYPERNQLKKEGVVIHFRTGYRVAASVAAVLTLLFGLYFLISKHDNSATFHADTITKTPVKEGQETAISIPDPLIIEPEIIIHQELDRTVLTTEKPLHFTSMPLNPISALQWDGKLKTGHTYLAIEKRVTFSDIDLSEDLSRADESRPSFAGRFIRGVTSKVIGQPELTNKSLVEITIEGYNLIADRQVEVDKKYDEDGNIIAYNFRGESISFFRNISKMKRNP
ncbi:MAG: hypothetical protein ACNA7V_14530 [Bacteroidales bacterium]